MLEKPAQSWLLKGGGSESTDLVSSVTNTEQAELAYLQPRGTEDVDTVNATTSSVTAITRAPGRLTAILPVAAVAAAAFGAYLLCKSTGGKNGRVNKTIDKDSPKVVHSFDVEDIGSKAAYCRCWRSKKFPYCDGSHGKHNQETGDNVGPLIIKRRDA